MASVSEAGKYRTTNVRIGGINYQPPEAFEVPRLMDEWARWVLKDAKKLHPVMQAALAHHRFVAIHPFVDGNGRTGRLIMNLLLMRNGYPPAIIQRANRKQYYRVLDQADYDKPVPLVNFVGRAVERSLTLYLQAVVPSKVRPRAARGKVAQDKWIPLREAVIGTPYSQDYLSLLARLGRLDAMNIGRIWHTTREAVKAYERSVARSG